MLQFRKDISELEHDQRGTKGIVRNLKAIFTKRKGGRAGCRWQFVDILEWEDENKREKKLKGNQVEQEWGNQLISKEGKPIKTWMYTIRI